MKIEKKYLDIYQRYSTNKDPESLNELIQALNPVLRKGINTFGYGIPTLYGRAKLLAKNAIETYDPNKAPLESHVMLHLQRLQRYAPRTGNVLDVSEGQRMLARELSNAEKELEDKYNRPPSDAELADYLGINVRRIAMARTAYGAAPESVFEGNVEVTPLEQKQSLSDKERLWMETVYQELSPMQQYIAERRLGLFGHKVEPVEVIAKRLKISPAMVSQHMKTIQQKMVVPRDL